MAAVGHFGCPKFTFDRISGHFRSIWTFIFFWNFLQNGHRRPFWMSKIHFRLNFWPFQNSTQLYSFCKFLTKWLPSAILDVRNSLSIAFLAISDRYATLFFLEICDKMAASAIFYIQKSLSIAFVAISDRYSTIFFLEIFDKMAVVGNSFSIAFLANLDKYGILFFWKCFTKWPPEDILDVRKSLLIAFLVISDRSAILDVWNSLSIVILAISDRYRIFFFRRPFWMSENHFWLYFWPFLIDLPFWMSEIHFRSHFWPFQIDTRHFWGIFLDKMAAGGHLDWTTMSIIELVRDIWMNNAYVKFEERSLNPSKVIELTTKLWRGGRGGPRGGCVADENIIFPKTYVSREDMDIV